ncbi:hypothetical protein PSH87_00890 [Pseudomonas sp. FP453]|uniref:hypothetical protein n=1 Tax=Pseudomonas sp. FP453 TaxID=2954094 RepID=UPI002733FD0A|nr:hypothetical protein [Pseudomonas sp. FP453]WLH90617.1 hypothetical protein PSH87_00890 [Pseudomonas sp. FP453]
MSDKLFQEQLRESPGVYIYFLSLYSVGAGALYLWGYWSPFGVNILEYVNLTDIVKSTIYPIASTFIFLVLGVMMGQLVGVGPELPPGEGRNSPPARFIIRHKRLLIFLYIAGTLMLMIYGPVEKWLGALPVLLGAPIALYASANNVLARQIPADGPRTLCLFLLAALPFIAFGTGQLRAAAVLNGKAFDYVVDNITITPDANPLKSTRFIGHAGDFFFFLEPEKLILSISKFDTVKTLRLGRFEHKR